MTALLTAGLMAGCTGNSNRVSPEPADVKEETTVVEEQTEVDPEPIEETLPEDEQPPMVGMSRWFDYTEWSGDESADWLALYEAFIGDEETVTVGEDIPYLEEGYYTLTEMVEGIKASLADNFMPNELLEVDYSLIDGGNDGYPELVIMLPFSDPDGTREAPTDYIIIRPFYGELSIITIEESLYRTQTIINEYGFILSSGSNGAAGSGADYKVITAEGELCKLCSVTTYFGLGSAVICSEALSESLKAEITNSDAEGGDYLLRVLNPGYESDIDPTTQFDEYKTDNCKNYYYSFCNQEFEDVEVDQDYIDLCAEYGIRVISSTEFDSMIDSVCSEFGATKDIRDGAEPEYSIIVAG